MIRSTWAEAAWRGVLAILLVTIATPALAADAASAAFVDHGNAARLDDYFRLGTARPDGEALAVDSATPEQVKQFRQHTASTVLLGGKAIDDGDFHVTCRASLIRRDDSSSP